MQREEERIIYHKLSVNDEVEIRVPIYNDEIFTQCPGCGKEIQVEPDTLAEIIKDGGDMGGTSIYCKECSLKRPNDTVRR